MAILSGLTGLGSRSIFATEIMLWGNKIITKEGSMKIFVTIAIIFALTATIGIPGSGAEEGQKSYTAYNYSKIYEFLN